MPVAARPAATLHSPVKTRTPTMMSLQKPKPHKRAGVASRLTRAFPPSGSRDFFRKFLTRPSRSFLCCNRQSAIFSFHRRSQRRAARQGRAEIGKALAIPGKPLRMNVPVIPSRLRARFGVINDPVLRLAKGLHERAMSYAPNLVRLFEYRPLLLPRLRIQHLISFVVQQSQAIIRRPTSARRINNEQIAIAFENLRPLANRHRHSLPRLTR